MQIDSLRYMAEHAQNVGDFFRLCEAIVEFLDCYVRELDDTLTNLDSDNVKELDFSQTRIKNFPVQSEVTEE